MNQNVNLLPDHRFVPSEWPYFHYVDRSLVEREGGFEATLRYAISRSGSLDSATTYSATTYFVERFVFPVAPSNVTNETKSRRLEVVDRLLDHLWLVAGLSYYKTSAATTIRIEGVAVGDRDLELHRLLLMRGLGEFCFVNQLSPELRPEYVVSGATERPPIVGLQLAAGPMCPVGGGKDSCVSIEALRAAALSPTLVTVRRFPIIQHVINDAELPDVAVERHLDSNIGAMNAAGALNGHVPATAIVSFAVMIAAVLNGHDAVVMSNERSASEGNVEYRGVSINHQWAKSDEAEAAIVSALARITPEVRWFSLLRPLSELEIARRFAATCERYFGSFSSCNRTQYIDAARRSTRWCGECPKCQFVYLALSTSLSREQVETIWEAELFSTSPIDGFRALLGLAEWKPFECVGEHLECRVALALVSARADWTDHPVLAALAEEVRSVGGWPTQDDVAACFSLADAPFVPNDYAGVIHAAT